MQRLTALDEALMATCVIVRGELMFMAQKSEHRASNLRQIEALLNDLEVYPVDEETADVYGRLKAALLDRFGPRRKLRRQKTRIEALGFTENDLWIAAIAKRHGLVVVSSDSDFERIAEVEDLRLEAWWAPGVEPAGP